MEKNDQQILGILSASLIESGNERILIIQQKGFRQSTFPLNKNEKVPINLSIPITEQINYIIKKVVNPIHDILPVIKRHQHK